jgi:hypothetical protein
MFKKIFNKCLPFYIGAFLGAYGYDFSIFYSTGKLDFNHTLNIFLCLSIPTIISYFYIKKL